MKTIYRLHELAELLGTQEKTVIYYIENEWLRPAFEEPLQFDLEDLARARLIREMQIEFDVNDEAIPIILHLLDQIHRLRLEIKARSL